MSIQTYLTERAEPEALAAARLEGRYAHVLQVPAYGETEDLFATLGSVPAGPRGEVLIVVVLNARADSSPAVHEANDAARRRLSPSAAPATVLWQDPPITAIAFPHGRVVLIDRAAPGRFLPKGQGVGLARKIGCDFALSAVASGRLSADWLHCTDADVRLPNDYFDQTEALALPAESAVYFFRHRFDPDQALGQAGRLYEVSLRYGVLGLAWAGSPYAYEAMGSCIAVRPNAYAAIGGFPRRNAKEDIHALNSLAAVGPIARLGGAPVELSGRVSDRVRISTGQALSRLVAQPRARDGFRLDHPIAFAHLAALLEALEATASSGSLEKGFAALPEDGPFFRKRLLTEALEELGAFAAIREALGQGGEPADRRRRLHTWFDAWRTRALLEGLRAGLPLMSWREALSEAPFTGLQDSAEEDLDLILVLLAEQERTLSATTAGLPATTALGR